MSHLPALQANRDTDGTPGGQHWTGPLALLTLLAALLVAAWLAFDEESGAATHDAIRAMGQIALEAVATVLALAASTEPGTDYGSRATRRAWRWLGAGFGVDLAASIVWRLSGRPTVSLSDLGFLARYPLLMCGLLAFPRWTPRPPAEPTTESRWTRFLLRGQFWLDVATVVLSAAMAIWYFLLVPLAGTGHGSPLERAVLVAYPVADIGLLFGLVPLLLDHHYAPTGTRGRAPFTLLGLSFSWLLAADFVYSSLMLSSSPRAERFAEIAYTLSYGVFAVSAAAQRGSLRAAAARVARAFDPFGAGVMRRWIAPLVARPAARLRAQRPARSAERPFSVLPYVAVAAAYVLVLRMAARDATTARVAGLMAGAALLTALVTLRQYATLHENARLLRERAEREAHFRHRALHDPLTGLANRAHFEECLERALTAHAQRGDGGRCDGGRLPAVLYLDLDDFKLVNDSLGHAAGDRLLSTVAVRLLEATRGSDVVARLGGDEFAVLLGGVRDEHEAVVVADRIVAALRAPVMLDRVETQIGASVGVALAHRGVGASEALRNADLAMYRAKRGGKQRHALFEPALHASAVARMSLLADLRQALDAADASFHVAYQPIVELDTERVVAVEALARWTHPTRGDVSPGTFIPLAEESDLIRVLGLRVLRAACVQVAEWRVALAPTLTVNVNVSARELDDETYVDDVAAALDAAGLPPSALVLEVTESAVARDPERARARLEVLRSAGIRIAIDDFGTGHSSLAALHQLPTDVLKIDRAFVSHLSRDADPGPTPAARGTHLTTPRGSDARLAAVIVSIGDALRVPCVAEGVELVAQRDALLALGCRYAQGFYFARPLLADALRMHLGGDVAPAAGSSEACIA